MDGWMDGLKKNRAEEPAQFIYLLKYLLNAYYMPGIVLDTKDTRVYKNVLKTTKKKKVP